MLDSRSSSADVGTSEIIKQIIAVIIEVESEKITPNAHFVEELGADSMAALEIMAALEKQFGIVISEDYLPKMTNLREVTLLVESLSKK